jgi:hypothetical protein
VLRAPFDKEDPPFELRPLGETILHTDPHNGIDLIWDHKVPVLTAASGLVVEILPEVGSHEGQWRVTVKTGQHYVGYHHLESYHVDLEKGNEIAEGSMIGFPSRSNRYYARDPNRGIHWEFGYAQELAEPIITPEGMIETFRYTRLCPLSYFTDEAREQLEAIYDATTWKGKEEFPEVCSGVYRQPSEAAQASGYASGSQLIWEPAELRVAPETKQ